MENESRVTPAAAALIADSVIFKASGKLERALQPFREVYGQLSAEEVERMTSGAKIVYRPRD